MPMPSREILLDNFYYDETSPSCLRRNKTVRSGRSNNILMYSKGDVVGHISSRGYYCVMLDGNRLSIHRVVWILLNGEISEDILIDHIDRVKVNNLISNLRLVDSKTNSQNKKKHITNSTGKTGVQLFRDYRYDPPRLHWRAIWRDGKSRCKSFSVAKFGYEAAKELACRYRDKMLKELNEKGNNYSATHGF